MNNKLISVLALTFAVGACAIDAAPESEAVTVSTEQASGDADAEKSCCKATRAGMQPTCSELGDSEENCTSVRDCAWSDAPSCSEPPACCTATREGFEEICAERSGSFSQCTSLRDCAWTDSAECPSGQKW